MNGNIYIICKLISEMVTPFLASSLQHWTDTSTLLEYMCFFYNIQHIYLNSKRSAYLCVLLLVI